MKFVFLILVVATGARSAVVTPEKAALDPAKLIEFPAKKIEVVDKPAAAKPVKLAEKPVKVVDKPIVVLDKAKSAPEKQLVISEVPVAVTPVVLVEPAVVLTACNIQGANSLKPRLAAESFCNDPDAISTGLPLLLKFVGIWSWSYAPVLNACRRHQLNANGTSKVFLDVRGNPELAYIDVNGVLFRDQPPKWHCASVSTNFLPLDSSPDNNVILQVECVPSGYEFSVNIQDFTKVTDANRAELTTKFGFDLSGMDAACALLVAPVA